MTRHLLYLLAAALLLAACAEVEPPPRSVNEFVEDPILLEAAIVRCSRNRDELRYDQECMNAREAVKIVQAREEETRRAELEARSEAKRRALRRRQEAQAEARRLAEEERRRREEAEYLAQFGVLPPADDGQDEAESPEGNVPLMVIPEATATPDVSPAPGNALPAGDGSNAPTAETVPAEDPPADDDEDGA
jgi:hypothetical protein